MSRLWTLLVCAACACSSVQTVRIQGENVYAGQHLRPIAIVHAQVTSAYVLFLALPGHVDLDHVVNRMLLPAAKMLGADKVVDIKVEITPDTGVWVLRKLIGWRSAEASGVAVVVEPDTEAPALATPPAAK